MTNAKNILVTGSHRSGTTWVGKSISDSCNKFHFIYEPFNPQSPPGMAQPHFQHLYYYVDGGTFPEYETAAKNLLKGKFPAFGGKKSPIKSRLSLLRKSFGIAKAKHEGKKFLIKSSEAMLWSEYFMRHLETQVLMIVRHPCAFVASCERMEWGFDLNNLIIQDSLYQKFISAEIGFSECDVAGISPRIIQNTWLWLVLYKYALFLKKFTYENDKELLLVNHEDLCNEPIQCFKNIFSFLNLDFSPNTQRNLLRETTGDIVVTDTGIQHYFTRNSKKTAVSWKNVLDRKTIDWIQSVTKNVANEFYANESWNLSVEKCMVAFSATTSASQNKPDSVSSFFYSKNIFKTCLNAFELTVKSITLGGLEGFKVRFLCSCLASIGMYRTVLRNSMIQILNESENFGFVPLVFWRGVNKRVLHMRKGNVSDYLVGGELVRGAYAPPRAKPTAIVDCGANIGMFSLIASAYFPKTPIICYEPDQNNMECLNANLKRNGIVASVSGKAVWSEETRLYYHANDSYTGYVDRNASEFSIECTRAEVPEGCWLKLDIEGAEYEVLPEILLRGARPSFISMEIHFNNQKGKKLINLLEESGYRLRIPYDSVSECVNIEAEFLRKS
jgi:FkbM family methyltransferase